MKLKLTKLLAALSAIFISSSAFTPCSAIHPINQEVQNELEKIYTNYKLEKEKANTFSEHLIASAKFFKKFGDLRKDNQYVLRNFLEIFCSNNVPESIKMYTNTYKTLATLAVDKASGCVVCHLESENFDKKIIYVIEL